MIEYMNKNDFIDAIKLLNNGSLYIAGAGKYGCILGEYLDKHNVIWKGFADKNNGLNNGRVFSYQEIEEKEAHYIISSYIYKNDILSELRDCGVASENIITYKSQDVFYEIYEELFHWKKYTHKLKKYKDKYQNKRCFIIGNGPSLKLEDLEKLSDEITFASNSIYAIYKNTKWRPTYYCVTDSLACQEIMNSEKSIKTILEGCCAAFTSVMGEGFRYRDNSEMEKVNYLCIINSDRNNLNFSSEITEQIYGAGTVSYEMIQLAVYMGFNQIYLIGMDCNYSIEKYKDGSIVINNVKNHMDQLEEEEKRYDTDKILHKQQGCFADIDLFFAGYSKAKEYADSHGIKIYNSTRGGKLEIFERVNFDTIFV